MALSTAEKSRETRIRNTARRRGMELTRSRRRDPLAIDYGRYMLIDVRTNGVILGGSPWAYSATLDDVEDYLVDRQDRPPATGTGQ